jgi:hypothetical protein
VRPCACSRNALAPPHPVPPPQLGRRIADRLAAVHAARARAPPPLARELDPSVDQLALDVHMCSLEEKRPRRTGPAAPLPQPATSGPAPQSFGDTTANPAEPPPGGRAATASASVNATAQAPIRVAIISTWPPERCGIATFASALVDALIVATSGGPAGVDSAARPDAVTVPASPLLPPAQGRGMTFDVFPMVLVTESAMPAALPLTPRPRALRQRNYRDYLRAVKVRGLVQRMQACVWA